MNQMIHTTIALLCLLQFCFSANPGIRFELSQGGISQISAIVEPIVKAYIEVKGSFPISNQSSKGVDYEFNFTQLNLNSIKWNTFSLAISSGEGIVFTMSDLSFNLNYTLNYHVTFPPLNGGVDAVAKVEISSMGGQFAFSQVNGIPKIQLENFSVTVGTLDLGLPGFLGSLLNLLDPIVRGLFEYEIPSQVTSTVNQDLTSVTSNLTMTEVLPYSHNQVIFDYSLLQDPIFTTNLVTIDFKGDVHSNVDSTCPMSPFPMQSLTERNAQLYISNTVLMCLLMEYENSGNLNYMVNELLSSFLPLGNRMNIEVDLDQAMLAITEQGISFLTSLNVDFNRTSVSPELYLSLNVNITIEISISLQQNGSKISVIPQLTNLQVFNIRVDHMADDMPEIYQQEISNTNFTVLVEEANDFIRQTVPGINQKLASGFQLPQIVSQFLLNPELKMMSGYLFLGTDLGNNKKTIGLNVM